MKKKDGGFKQMARNMYFLDTMNAIGGVAVAVLTYVLGEHWYLFAFFLFMNVVDYITGCMKSTIAHKLNSNKGWIGVLKKLGYWIMIVVAFAFSVFLVEIGKMLGIDFRVTTLLGWFVLSSLCINEVRSIIENLVQCGYNVPKPLTKGLEVADKLINEEQDNDESKADD
jgi:toxin secretion/phage lysis holin